MSKLQAYKRFEAWTMSVFRLDLQVHFFWGFLLTFLGVYWWPLLASGILVTVLKEALDLWSKNHWCWKDFWAGVLGCACAVGFIYVNGHFFCP